MSRPNRLRCVSIPSRTLALTCLAAWFVASTGIAQDSPPVQKPLPEHKILAADEGAWDFPRSGSCCAGRVLTHGPTVSEVQRG